MGQSEFAVADMVDMFVLLLPPAGGDELQVSLWCSGPPIATSERANVQCNIAVNEVEGVFEQHCSRC